jgi:hypothetical protein
MRPKAPKDLNHPYHLKIIDLKFIIMMEMQVKHLLSGSPDNPSNSTIL